MCARAHDNAVTGLKKKYKSHSQGPYALVVLEYYRVTELESTSQITLYSHPNCTSEEAKLRLNAILSERPGTKTHEV